MASALQRVKSAASVSEIRQAIEEAQGKAQEPSGTLRINSSISAAHEVLLPLIAEFLRRYPAMTVDLVTETRMIDIVLQGFHRALQFHRTLWSPRPMGQRRLPGMIYPPQLDSWFLETARRHLGSDDAEAGKDYVLKNIFNQTVNRLGQPADIASAVCFLASPISDFMTGTTFRIDGGVTHTV